MKLREPELYSNGGGGNGSNGKTGDCGHLVLVDFGICAEVPLYTRQSLACALMHLMHRDFESLADTFAGMSLMRATDLDAEVAELSVALKHAFHDVAPVSIKRFESAPATETTAGEASYRARLQRFTFIGVAERLISLSVSFPLVFGDYTISLLRFVMEKFCPLRP
jgi:predicted unusual protein kinase regulating ubiquinone biosynthesis (AarF/ABC1/UbiB family)